MPRVMLMSAVVVVAVVGVGVAVSRCTPVSARCFSATQPTPTAAAPTEVSQVLGPRYRTYTEAALVEAQNQGQAVLYFWAPWCATCSSLDDELQKQQDVIPDSVTVLRVPYDTASVLKKQYAVTAQHTLVILDDQKQAQKMWVGGDAAYLRQQIEAVTSP